MKKSLPKIIALRQKLMRLRNRPGHTPARLPKNQCDPEAQRATLKTERRNLVDVIKIDDLVKSRRKMVSIAGASGGCPS
jgi:hypothetical protein